MSSAKSVITELSSSKTVHMVKLYCYRNGDGRAKSGELLLGSNIQGVKKKYQSTCIFQLKYKNFNIQAFRSSDFKVAVERCRQANVHSRRHFSLRCTRFSHLEP